MSGAFDQRLEFRRTGQRPHSLVRRQQAGRIAVVHGPPRCIDTRGDIARCGCHQGGKVVYIHVIRRKLECTRYSRAGLIRASQRGQVERLGRKRVGVIDIDFEVGIGKLDGLLVTRPE